MSDSNGGNPGDLIARLADELRGGIAAEQVARIDHERLVKESVQREKRLQRTLNALEGTGPGRKPAKPAPKPSGRSSEEKMTRTLAILGEAREPMTVNQVTEALGVGSRETARKALEQLRERGQVRMAGVVKQNRQPTNTYALMPSGGDYGAGQTAD